MVKPPSASFPLWSVHPNQTPAVMDGEAFNQKTDWSSLDTAGVGHFVSCTQINRALSFLNSLELMAEFDPTLKAGYRELE